MTTININQKEMSELRVMASEVIFKRFGKAPVIVAQYGKLGAYAHCVWKDGVREFMYIDYKDLTPESQHDYAMNYIKTVV